MRAPPSTNLPDEPGHADGQRGRACEAVCSSLGLSQAEYDDVVKAMLPVVWRIGCPAHIHPLEVVHDAFVLAICKPISQRPAITERKKFLAWMCTLAEFAALSNRKSKHRRLLGQGQSDDDIAALLSVPGHAEAIAVREVLHKAFAVLEPADQALLLALHRDGKTIAEIAREQNLAWSTVNSRHKRILSILRTAMQSLLAALILFITRNARAQGRRIALRIIRALPHATQTTCAMAVTAACGILVPTSSSANSTLDELNVYATSLPPNFAATTRSEPIEPSMTSEVALVKPNGVDEPKKQCSASDMKPAQAIQLLRTAALPVALLVTPPAAAGCAGADRHTSPPDDPEEEESGGIDPYEMMCANEHRRGNECPTKAEWYRSMGRCPDGTKGCQ